MDAWPPAHVPVISTLSKNFATFDQYYSSVPGPTDVNRLYFHSATSYGEGTNEIPMIIWGYPQKSIYHLLDEAGYDWAGYFGEVSDPLFFQYTRQPQFWNRFHFMDDFHAHARNGTLPTFTFISPKYFTLETILANDQHPAHAVSLGEKLMKDVYESLRASPLWESSALFLTYDEHGGYYDHVAPPMNGVPNPDGMNSNNPPFNFDRLGIRIPSILISPWVDAQVIHSPPVKPTPTSEFEHTSVIATLRNMWGLGPALTKRDAWAAPFDFLFKLRQTPRKDCPTSLPNPFQTEAHRAYLRSKVDKPEHLQPLSDLHVELIQLGNAVAGLPPNSGLDWIRTEHDGGTYLRNLMANWIERNRQITLQQEQTLNKN